MHLPYRVSYRVSELRNLGFFYFIFYYFISFFIFHVFILKFPSYEKLAMTLQFDLTRLYDVITRNSVF